MVACLEKTLNHLHLIFKWTGILTIKTLRKKHLETQTVAEASVTIVAVAAA